MGAYNWGQPVQSVVNLFLRFPWIYRICPESRRYSTRLAILYMETFTGSKRDSNSGPLNPNTALEQSQHARSTAPLQLVSREIDPPGPRTDSLAWAVRSQFPTSRCTALSPSCRRRLELASLVTHLPTCFSGGETAAADNYRPLSPLLFTNNAAFSTETPLVAPMLSSDAGGGGQYFNVQNIYYTQQKCRNTICTQFKSTIS